MPGIKIPAIGAPSRRARSRLYITGKTIDCARASHTFCAAGGSECCGLRWPNRVRPVWRPSRRRGRHGRWAEPSRKGIMSLYGRSTPDTDGVRHRDLSPMGLVATRRCRERRMLVHGLLDCQSPRSGRLSRLRLQCVVRPSPAVYKS